MQCMALRRRSQGRPRSRVVRYLALQMEMERANIGVAALASELGVKRQTIYAWLWGTKRPRRGSDTRIAEVLAQGNPVRARDIHAKLRAYLPEHSETLSRYYPKSEDLDSWVSE